MNTILFLHKHKELSLPILRVLMMIHLKIGSLFIPRKWYPAQLLNISMSMFKKHTDRFDELRIFSEKVLDPNYKPMFTVTKMSPD